MLQAFCPTRVVGDRPGSFRPACALVREPDCVPLTVVFVRVRRARAQREECGSWTPCHLLATGPDALNREPTHSSWRPPRAPEQKDSAPNRFEKQAETQGIGSPAEGCILPRLSLMPPAAHSRASERRCDAAAAPVRYRIGTLRAYYGHPPARPAPPGARSAEPPPDRKSVV